MPGKRKRVFTRVKNERKIKKAKKEKERAEIERKEKEREEYRIARALDESQRKEEEIRSLSFLDSYEEKAALKFIQVRNSREDTFIEGLKYCMKKSWIFGCNDMEFKMICIYHDEDDVLSITGKLAEFHIEFNDYIIRRNLVTRNLGLQETSWEKLAYYTNSDCFQALLYSVNGFPTEGKKFVYEITRNFTAYSKYDDDSEWKLDFVKSLRETIEKGIKSNNHVNSVDFYVTSFYENLFYELDNVITSPNKLDWCIQSEFYTKIAENLDGLAIELMRRVMLVISWHVRADVVVKTRWCTCKKLWEPLILMRFPVSIFMVRVIDYERNTQNTENAKLAVEYKRRSEQYWGPIEYFMTQIISFDKGIQDIIFSFFNGLPFELRQPTVGYRLRNNVE